MKRVNPGAIAALVVVLACGVSASNAQAATVNVDIVLVDSAAGDCVLMSPKQLTHDYFHVKANPGDGVNWNINNNCGRTVEVGISAFGPKIAGDPIENPLVQAADTLKKRVTSKSTGTFTGTVKPTATLHKTHVYEIQEIKTGGVRVKFADPEIEIP